MTTRSVRAELMRLRSDVVLLGCLAFAVAMAGALVLSVPRGTAPSLVSYLGTGVLQAVMAAALYGAINFCVGHRAGVTARSVLLSHRSGVLGAKTVAAAVSGGLIGLVGGLVSLLVLSVAMSTVDTPGGVVPVVLGGVLAGALAAVLGLFVGVAVRNYFFAPMLVLLVLVGSGAVLDAWPELGSLLPMAGYMAIVSGSVLSGVGVQALWLLVAGTVAYAVITVRDLG